MASLLTHGIAAVGIGACVLGQHARTKVWVAGVMCAMVPDVDVVGFETGIQYGDFWGHRGFTHSIAFAAVAATIGTCLVSLSGPWSSRIGKAELSSGQRGSAGRGINALVVWGYLFLAVASHGVLDAMTNGGLGVAFFSPFDNARYFLPWRPIIVSPIGVAQFFGERGWAVLRSEFLWVWIPAGVVGMIAWGARRLSSDQRSATGDE